jgi:hypothetical protein
MFEFGFSFESRVSRASLPQIVSGLGRTAFRRRVLSCLVSLVRVEFRFSGDKPKA